MEGVVDSSRQIESLLHHDSPSSRLTPPHRHRPPQIHLDFDETSIHTSRTLGETGEFDTFSLLILRLRPVGPETDGPRWMRSILISLLHMGPGGRSLSKGRRATEQKRSQDEEKGKR